MGYKHSEMTNLVKLYNFLPRDATRMRRLYCRPVSVCQSVCHIGVLYPDGG